MTNEEKFGQIFGIELGEECTDSDICKYRDKISSPEECPYYSSNCPFWREMEFKDN